jgi:hypothetical protein
MNNKTNFTSIQKKINKKKEIKIKRMFIGLTPYLDDMGQLEFGVFEFPLRTRGRTIGRDLNMSFRRIVLQHTERMSWVFFYSCAAAMSLLIALSSDETLFSTARFLLASCCMLIALASCFSFFLERRGLMTYSVSNALLNDFGVYMLVVSLAFALRISLKPFCPIRIMKTWIYGVDFVFCLAFCFAITSFCNGRNAKPAREYSMCWIVWFLYLVAATSMWTFFLYRDLGEIEQECWQWLNEKNTDTH